MKCYALGSFPIHKNLGLCYWSNKYTGNCGTTLHCFLHHHHCSLLARDTSSCTIWVCSAYRTQGCKLNQITTPKYCSIYRTLSSRPIWNTKVCFISFSLFFFFTGSRGSGLPHQEPQTAVLALQCSTNKGEHSFYKAQFDLWF